MGSKLKRPSWLQKFKRRIDIWKDSVAGLDFLTVVPVLELGLDEALVVKCSPSWSVLLEKIFLDLNITSEDKILDIGCGKGAVLRGLCKFPFGKIDGLELSDVLAAIARKNFRVLKTNRVNIFNINAVKFNGFDEYNIFYLYNPFPKVVVEKLMAKLSGQLSHQRETLIIYNNPVCHLVIEANGFIKVSEYPDEWGNGIFCYSNKPNNGRFQQLNLR